MQDPSLSAAVTFPQLNAQFPEHEQLRCPRCDSTNTKFCYYNNYNLSQPRHFCKNCKRYWTKGGALRNIPVGGGTRKNSTKRSAPKQQPRPVQNPSASLAAATTTSSSGLGSAQSENSTLKTEPVPILKNPGTGVGSGASAGSFTSLLGLASDGQFGNLTDGWNQNGLKIGLSNGSGPVQNLGLELMQRSGMSSEGFMLSGLQNGSETSCWGSSNGWSDHLAIHTPVSKFQ